jgi:histidine phosphotransferase ChpT
MATITELSELDLAALMSSKICHDIVGPVGAINNGLELLEEEEDEQTRAYALQLIQNSARSAAARLEFARLAFGASSGLGGAIDLGMAERVARGFV